MFCLAFVFRSVCISCDTGLMSSSQFYDDSQLPSDDSADEKRRANMRAMKSETMEDSEGETMQDAFQRIETMKIEERMAYAERFADTQSPIRS